MSFLSRLLGRKKAQVDETIPTSSQDDVRPETKPGGPEQSEPGTPAQSGAGLSRPGLAEEMAEAPLEGNGELAPAQRSREPTAPKAGGLHVGYASDVGQMRDHNEDTLIVIQGMHLGDDASDPFGFFVVSDGMGGHRAGEVASSLAARLVSREVLSKVYVPFLLKETTGDGMAPLTEVLRNAVQSANGRVYEQVPGGGTTLTCALIVGRRAFIAHVGDSRAYLLTNCEIQQVTQDHSYVGRLMELGELSPEEAAVHPQRHVLYRAIGQGDNLDIDIFHQPLPPGSRLLLCSDGLSGTVSEEEIGRIIAAASTPQEACETLLEAANAAGGPDNITAVLVETPLD